MIDRSAARKKRHLKVRKKIFGTKERPRLCVFRSSKHVYAQVIDDTVGNTLASFCTLNLNSNDVEVDVATFNKCNKNFAKIVGSRIAKLAIENGITNVVFDRSGYVYHGCIKELADGAREGGLNF